jgi:signal transduction histidine kinase
VLALLLASWPWMLERLLAPPAEWRLSSASFASTVDDPLARMVRLPHRWLGATVGAGVAADCAACRTAWYRFDLGAAAAARSEPQALWLTDVGSNAAAYLNGRLLGSGGRFSDPAARLGVHSLWLPVPQQAWNDGDNRLYLLVKAERGRFGHLGAPALGPEAELQARERWRSALMLTLPQVLATAAAMLGLVMALLWAYRRREADYGALAAVLLAWAAQHFSAAVVEPPLGDAAWDAWLGASFALFVAALGWFAWRQARVRVQPRAAGGAALIGALGFPLVVALAAAAPLEPSGLAIDAMRSVLMAFAALAGAALVVAGWSSADGRLLVPGALLALTTAAAALWPWLAAQPPAAAPVLALPWAMAVFAGSLGWLLLLRFVHTLDAAELLAEDLEALVRERTTELQAQFERVRELERREAIAAERERLMRDMHDGVGGHLVSMLAMIEAADSGSARGPQALATAVRDALDDMRLMIDSLEPVDDDLNAVLAMFHDRLAPRLRAAGVALHWEVELLPQVAGLTPARVLHVLRILQEAVTNAVRHGRAKGLRLDAAGGERGVHIELTDDGAGFDPACTGSGRGLNNMRRRAALAGAALQIDAAPGRGTRVRLELPLQAAPEPMPQVPPQGSPQAPPQPQDQAPSPSA